MAPQVPDRSGHRARELFEAALSRRGIRFRRFDDGRYTYPDGALEKAISPENAFRDFLRDGDPAVIEGFVDAALSPDRIPDHWLSARTGLRLSAEPAEAMDPRMVHEPVSDYVAKALVWTGKAERTIGFVSEDWLRRWATDRESAVAEAASNMDMLLASTELQFADAEGHRLVMFATYSVFKASLVFAPSIRSRLEPLVGWPALAVIPCRDFAYAFPENDDFLMSRLGATVIKEFEGSGYSLTPEVPRLSDSGIEAIGSFAQ